VCPQPQAFLVFKEEWQGGRGSGIGGARCFSNCHVFSLHHVHLQEGNHYGYHSGSWEEPTGRAADACQSTPHDDLGSYYGGSKV
jgi:hypothetical protein